MTKNLTYNEMLVLAEENYYKGGDCFVECWTEEMFNNYVEEFGPVTKEKAMRMFEMYVETAYDMACIY